MKLFPFQAFQSLTFMAGVLALAGCAGPDAVYSSKKDEDIPPLHQKPAPLPISVMANAAAVVEDRIYSLGGYGSRAVLKQFFVYDSSSNRWSREPDMPQGRCFHAVVSLGDKIYVFGGLNEIGSGAGFEAAGVAPG